MRRRITLLTAAGLAAALLLYVVTRVGPASSEPAEVHAAAQPDGASPLGVTPPEEGGALPRAAAEAVGGARSTPRAEPAGAIEVVITDPEGEPVAGAEVETFDDSTPTRRTTDAEGRCRLPLELEGTAFRVHVARQGYYHALATREREPQLELALFPAGSLSGRVVDLDDRPVVGAAVRSEPDCELCGPLGAVSDALGRFELTVPSGRPTEVEATAEGFVPSHRGFELRGEARELVLHLDHGLDLWIQVVDLETGAAIPGAVLGRDRVTVTADEEGRAHSRALFGVSEEESTRFHVKAEGYCDIGLVYDPVEARPGELIVARMVRSTSVAGVVMDANGVPVPDAWISLRRDYRAVRAHLRATTLLEGLDANELMSSFGRRRLTTDAEGRYSMDGLLPWEPGGRFSFGCAGFETQTLTPQVGEPGSTRRLDVVLPRLLDGNSGRISGTLRVAGTPTSGSFRWRGATASGSVRVEDDGTFEIEGVETGEVTATLTPTLLEDWEEESCGPGVPLEHTVLVTRDETARLDVDVPLELATLSGVVLDAAGQPAPEVGVWAGNHDTFCVSAQTLTDEEGRFEFEVLARFPAYDVGAMKNVLQVRREGVAPGTDDLELVLPGTCLLDYRVVAADTGRPLLGARLRLREAGEERFRGRYMSGAPDPEGWYRIDMVAGVYDVTVDTSRLLDYFPTTVEGVRVGAEPAEVELVLERALSLDLLRDEGQAAWPDGTVVLLLPEGTRDQVSIGHPSNPRSWTFGPNLTEHESGRYWTVSFRERGRARVRRLRRGRYTLEAFPEPIVFEPAVIEMRADMAPITMSWPSD